MTAFRNGETDSRTTRRPDQYDTIAVPTDAQLVARTKHFAIDVRERPVLRYIGWNEVLDGKPTPIRRQARVRQATDHADRPPSDHQRHYEGATLRSTPVARSAALTPQADPSIQPLAVTTPRRPRNNCWPRPGIKKSKRNLLVGPGRPCRSSSSCRTTRPTPFWVQIASFVKDAMARAGIIVEPTPTEFSVLIQRMKDKKVRGGPGRMDRRAGVQTRTRFLAPTQLPRHRRQQHVSYSNKEFDRVVAVRLVRIGQGR